MCVKCNINNCDCDSGFISKEVNLVRQYVLSKPGEQGEAGPPGEVPLPIRSNDLFDI